MSDKKKDNVVELKPKADEQIATASPMMPKYHIAMYNNKDGLPFGIGVRAEYGMVSLPPVDCTDQAIMGIMQLLQFSETARMRIIPADGSEEFDAALVACRDALPIIPIAGKVTPMGAEMNEQVGLDIYADRLRAIMPDITDEQIQGVWTATFNHSEALYNRLLQGADKPAE